MISYIKYDIIVRLMQAVEEGDIETLISDRVLELNPYSTSSAR